jgi:hypothetical protein
MRLGLLVIAVLTTLILRTNMGRPLRNSSGAYRTRSAALSDATRRGVTSFSPPNPKSKFSYEHTRANQKLYCQPTRTETQ